jgi:DNA-binding winged helix-turn-helix (wHTH) protein
MRLQFGPFRVDSHERTVRRDGKLVPLTPKVFDILMVLIQNPGRILTKDEMMQQVWPDTTVEESNLARNVPRYARHWVRNPTKLNTSKRFPGADIALWRSLRKHVRNWRA